MKLIGFNFNKISVEKQDSEIPGDLKVNTNIDVPEIRPTKPDFFKTKDEMVLVSFSYIINYEPSFAKINLSGHAALALEPKMAKNVLKQWKNKKMPEDFRNALFNLILTKSSVKALQLEEEMNLPYHIPLPKLRPQQTPPQTEEKKKKKK